MAKKGLLCILIAALYASATYANNLSLNYSLLFWQPREGGMAFATTESNIFTTTNFAHSNLDNPSYKWQPGFQIGISYNQWNINWLNYASSASGQSNANEFGGFFPVRSVFGTTTTGTYAQNAGFNSDINLNTINISFDNALFHKDTYQINYDLGLTNIFINQSGQANYSGGSFAGGTDRNSMNSRFYGIGPLFTINGKYLLPQNYSLLANASLSPLLGFFHLHQSENFGDQLIGNLNKNFTQTRYAFAFTAAIQRVIQLNKMYLRWNIGWDYLYFNQQNIFKHSPVINTGNINLIFSGPHFTINMEF